MFVDLPMLVLRSSILKLQSLRNGRNYRASHTTAHMTHLNQERATSSGIRCPPSVDFVLALSIHNVCEAICANSTYPQVG